MKVYPEPSLEDTSAYTLTKKIIKRTSSPDKDI